MLQSEGFFAGVGGALSLYLGIAIVMGFELLELCYDLFIGIWTFYNATKKRHAPPIG
jgi:hypothetical protein